MMESGLASMLLANSAVAARVAGRVYSLTLPEDGVTPAITLRTISSLREQTFEGTLGYAIKRVQIDCYGDDYLTAKSVLLAVSTALSDFTGTLPDGTVVADIDPDLETDLFDTDVRKYVAIGDFMISYTP